MNVDRNSSHIKTKPQIFKHTYIDNDKLPEAPLPLPWVSPFKLGGGGVYITKFITDEEGKEKPVDKRIFSPLVIEARTRDLSDKNWGLLVSVQTPDVLWHRFILPMELLANRNKFLEPLMRLGLRPEPGYQGRVHEYLLTSKPVRLVRCLTKTGWHKKLFVLPEYCFGQQPEDIFLQRSTTSDLFNCKGSIDEWKENIGKYCANNSRLIFAVSTAFAAPLLHLLGIEGGGIHFLGESSIGKSVLLNTAGSVVGGGGSYGFLRRWRTTDNAIENIAVSHNHCLLCLDEIGQVDSKVAAEIAYMLSNGQGKSRCNMAGMLTLLMKECTPSQVKSKNSSPARDWPANKPHYRPLKIYAVQKAFHRHH